MQSLFYGTPEELKTTANPSFSGQSETPAQQQPSNSFGGQQLPRTAATPSFGALGSSMVAQDVGIHVAAPSSVKEYAYTEDKNRQFRPQMEDTMCHQDKFCGDDSCGLFAVFDGHGGKTASEHCAEMMAIELKKEIQKNTSNELYAPLEKAFKNIDSQLAMMDAEQCGSTACVAVVRREINHNVLYVANVGDTRAVLCKNGQAERLSKDHKATDPQEIERVKAEGGSIMDNRVAGGLAITRALGDHAFKNFGVTSQPYTVRHVLRPFDKFLVIASDGVWDTVSDQDACDQCKEDLTTKQIAQNIVKLSLEKGSADNIACLVVRFNTGAF